LEQGNNGSIPLLKADLNPLDVNEIEKFLKEMKKGRILIIA
jgi:hypothetical protein